MSNLTTAHLFKSYLMSTYCVQDTALGLGMEMNKGVFSAPLKKLLWVRATAAGLQEDAECKV